MYHTTEELTLKLHTAANGHVWYSKNIGPPVNSEKIVDEFLRSSVLTGFGKAVRVLGTPQNAELISALYLRKYKREIAAVEVAGPNILNHRDDISDPRVVLLQMRTTGLAPACGGWHPVSMHDYPTYAMLARMLRTRFVFDDATQAYLQLHPAYKAARFIPTINEENLARLLTEIIDPRWYVDRRLPDRAAKLELFLGLTPQIQDKVSDIGCILRRTREFRCATVLNTWKTQDPQIADVKDPANFLYRIYTAAGGGPRGDLRASQALARYLRYNWLEALENRGGKKDGLFAPNLFFKTPAEIEAYATHMKTFKLPTDKKLDTDTK
ncbi:hypothetical protein EBZ39_00590 [bacterium]|nr:hypothetical protein [bacterium]